MHVQLIQKLATKQMEIKPQQKRQKWTRNQENYTKIENFSQKYIQKEYMFKWFLGWVRWKIVVLRDDINIACDCLD